MSLINEALSLDMFAAVCLFIEEVTKLQHALLNCRRQITILEHHIREDTIAPGLRRLQGTEVFHHWLAINEMSADKEHTLTMIAERLHMAYLHDIQIASNSIDEVKFAARRFFQEVPRHISEEGARALQLFNTHCRVGERMAAQKPNRVRRAKIRTW